MYVIMLAKMIMFGEGTTEIKVVCWISHSSPGLGGVCTPPCGYSFWVISAVVTRPADDAKPPVRCIDGKHKLGFKQVKFNPASWSTFCLTPGCPAGSRSRCSSVRRFCASFAQRLPAVTQQISATGGSFCTLRVLIRHCGSNWSC